MLVALFVLALAVTVFFLVRTVVFAVHWSDPQNQDLAIEGWMPLRYVARSWHIPPEVLGNALGLMPGARQTVADVAAARDSDVGTVSAELRAAIALWRAKHADD